MNDINITNARSGEILRWNGRIAVWQNIYPTDSEILRKERKDKLLKLKKICSKLEKK